MYTEMAIKYYSDRKNFKKALAAGIAMDNALKKEYGKGGCTNCRFMMSNYLKFFSYENCIH